MINYYKILGVQDFAQNEEIKTAYRKLSKKFHPDVNQGDKFFEERFKEIQAAYEALNDIQKRRLLDEYLKQSSFQSNFSSRQEQTKTETKSNTDNHSTTNKQDSNTDSQKNYKAHTSRSGPFKQKKNNNNLVILVVVFLTGIIVILIASNKNKVIKSSSPTSYSSTNSYQPSSQQYDNSSNYENQSPTNYKTSEKFSIGSTKKEVLGIQGNPTRIMKIEYLNEETWYYGLSSVTFKSGKVNEYSDNGNNLNVKYSNELPSDESQSSYRAVNFSIGSSKKDVLRIQGTPSRIMKIEYLNEETWYYGLSSVTFKNGKVNEYSDNGNNLSVKYSNELSSGESQSSYGTSYFSIGSSKKDVLRIQGTPTRTMKIEFLSEETWYYGLSNVTFKNGKVNEYSDNGNNLNVRY